MGCIIADNEVLNHMICGIFGVGGFVMADSDNEICEWMIRGEHVHLNVRERLPLPRGVFKHAKPGV